MLLIGSVSAPTSTVGQDVCARVRIEIAQRLVFERVAFEARLRIGNARSDAALENLAADINIKTLTGDPAEALFFRRITLLQNISAVDGTASLAPASDASITWQIIPSVTAGGTLPLGQTYAVSGTVTFTVDGQQQSMQLWPASFTVRPQPQLLLDYFLPRELQADDPFTDPAEPPIPFSFGVRVSNEGYGSAPNLRIASSQPRIVENKQGLLIDFKFLGSSVNGSAVAPTLTPQFGTIAPQACGSANWQMVTTLSGRFLDPQPGDVTFTHASELGGELTSLLKGADLHTLVHEVLVDLPGRDAITDFLAISDRNVDRAPDTIYESDCNDLPVNSVNGYTKGRPTVAAPDISLTTEIKTGTWTYTHAPDPALGLIPLVRALRSDGKQLDPHNFWISREQDSVDKSKYSFFINVVDYDTTGSYQLTYQRPAADTTPPVTTPQIGRPSHGTNPIFVTTYEQSLTPSFFTAVDDISGVLEISMSIDGQPFAPAFPFTFDAPGPHRVLYRSKDRDGNLEADKVLDFYADASAPVVSPVSAFPTVIAPAAPADVPADRATVVTVTTTDENPDLHAAVTIARGVAADPATLPVVRRFEASLASGEPRGVTWDGRDDRGLFATPGTYTITVAVDDYLGHATSVSTTVAVRDFADQPEVDPIANADQQYPRLAGNLLVWQDNRNQNWDVMLRGLDAGTTVDLTSQETTGQAADQTLPATDGRYVVWQDRRAGNWDIYLHDSADGSTRPLTQDTVDQQYAGIAAPWVVWQEKNALSGKWDVKALNIATSESVVMGAADTVPHDRIHPRISGSTVVWVDYRNGLGDIYAFDLAARIETRLTTNIDNQTAPAIDGTSVVWVDQRNANRDLYTLDLGGGERRLTSAAVDEAQPAIRGGMLAYSDHTAGLANPDIGLLDLATRRHLLVTTDGARQESPDIDGHRIVWQDNRTGRWQIRMASVDLGSVELAAHVGPGYNLVAVTTDIALRYPSAFALLAAWNSRVPVSELQGFDPATGQLYAARWSAEGTASGVDFPLVAGTSIVVMASASGDLSLGTLASCPANPLAPGPNYVGFSCVSPGARASDLLRAWGASAVASIARYDGPTGRWQTFSTKDGAIVGPDFPLMPGEGLLVYARLAAPAVQP